MESGAHMGAPVDGVDHLAAPPNSLDVIRPTDTRTIDSDVDVRRSHLTQAINQSREQVGPIEAQDENGLVHVRNPNFADHFATQTGARPDRARGAPRWVPPAFGFGHGPTVSLVSEAVDVLHVVPAYFPHRGGLEVLVENMAEVLDQNHAISSAVLVESQPGEEREELVHRGLRVYVASASPVIASVRKQAAGEPVPPAEAVNVFASLYAETRRVLRVTSPRLVHVHTSTFTARVAMAIATAENIPYLVHVHGLMLPGELASYRMLLRDTPWVCAVSDAVRESIRSDCDRISPIHVIRNGVVDFRAEARAWRPHSPSIAMVGRLTREKGFDDGLRAAALVRERFPRLRVRLVGSGPLAAELRALATELGLLDCLDYFGELANERALDVMAGSDVVLVPSNDVEGFSIVAVEAALLEVPVVATRVGGLPETVVDGVTGLLVPPRDVSAMALALGDLLDSPSRRRDLGEVARRRARVEFGMGRCASEMAALYATIWGAGAKTAQASEADDLPRECDEDSSRGHFG